MTANQAEVNTINPQGAADNLDDIGAYVAPPPPEPLDLDQLRPFLEQYVGVAECDGGCFVACGFGEAPGTYAALSPQIYVIENILGEAVDNLIAAFEAINKVPGLNAYLSAGLFKPRDQWANPPGRGKECDLIGAIATVLDFDAKHDPATCLDRLPLPPHALVETSPGNRQAWQFLDHPYPVAEAKPVFQTLAYALKTDTTFSCEHVFRPPGTWNWPTKTKIKNYDRAVEPQLARSVPVAMGTYVTSLDDLRKATLAKYPDASPDAPQKGDAKKKKKKDAGETKEDDGFDWRQRAAVWVDIAPEEYFGRRLNESGDRSSIAASVINHCIRSGWTPEEIFVALWAREDMPVMEHYNGSETRLRADIRRLWTKPAPEKNGAETFKEAATVAGDLVDQFRGRWPDEDEDQPDLTYFDADKTLPNSPDGAVVLLFGGKGIGKTNVTLTMIFEAMHGGARVCYAAGEGGHGVGKYRVPAHCKANGITTRSLRGKFRRSPRIPLLASEEQVTAFIAAQQDLQPNIIVLDTLATATAGEDENSAKASAFLTDNGPAGRIKRAYNALVLIPAHSGKDETKGLRGHSGFTGNADAVLKLEAEEAPGCILLALTVVHMRDGPDGHNVYFKAPPKGGAEVPVPVKITWQEYEALKDAPKARSGPQEGYFHRGLLRLVVRKALSMAEDGEPAKKLGGPQTFIKNNPFAPWGILGMLELDGWEPTYRQMWLHLTQAVKMGFLKYQSHNTGSRKGGAGYQHGKVPIDQMIGEDADIIDAAGEPYLSG